MCHTISFSVVITLNNQIFTVNLTHIKALKISLTIFKFLAKFEHHLMLKRFRLKKCGTMQSFTESDKDNQYTEYTFLFDVLM